MESSICHSGEPAVTDFRRRNREIERKNIMDKPLKVLTIEQTDRFVKSYFHSVEQLTFSKQFLSRYLLILLFLDAGLRLKEALNMRKMDLIWNNLPLKVITVRSEISKNGFSREIPTSIRLSEAISLVNQHCWSCVNSQPLDFAFANPRSGNPISNRSVELWLARDSINILGVRISPHTLRHTFATRLMSKCSIRVVQMLLGHKSLSSTQIYTHPNSNDLLSAINSI
jgi:site-specific recombinase XerD